jgi:hypothetical protein
MILWLHKVLAIGHIRKVIGLKRLITRSYNLERRLHTTKVHWRFFNLYSGLFVLMINFTKKLPLFMSFE